MRDKMLSIYQNRQSELEQLFIEAREYELLKVKTPSTVPNYWDDDKEED